MTESSVSR